MSRRLLPTTLTRLRWSLLALFALVAACGDNLHPAVPLSSAKEVTAYAFVAAENPGLPGDVVATITGGTIAATVPFGTNVTALKATFTQTGASIVVGGTTQVSGATANDFTSPVTYRVTALDGSTRDYTVTVTVAKSSAKEITTYGFLAVDNAGLQVNVAGVQNGIAIAVALPYGTEITALKARFVTTGVAVTVGATAQVSGTTANDFSSPVTYTVSAADGTTRDYVVTVTVALNPAKAITAFGFLSVDNAGLMADVTASINGTTITATVPYNTDVTALKAAFSTTGVGVAVGAVAQVSGTTANDFSSPVTYRVTAADMTTQDYTVTVTVAANPAKDLTAFSFTSVDNAVLPADVIGNINGTSVALTVPFGTNVTALIATFSTTGASVAVGGTAQVSGITANDFTGPVSYTVTAADGTTKAYIVTVTIAPSSAKDLTAFSFQSADNAGLLADVTGTINGTAIAVTVPFGTNVTALIATFATTGVSVKVGANVQASGLSAHGFTSPVTYRVTAADGSTQDYVVTVTVALNPAKDLTAFSLLTVNNSGLPANVTGAIVGTTVTATVPYGTTVTALKATFALTGASAAVGAVTQVSDVTANDFTNPVDYTVTAADGSTKTYTVTITVALNPAKDLTAFSFRTVNNGGLGPNVLALINGASITATVPFGTNVTALKATFTTTGASVAVGPVTQTSDQTPNDFTSPVTYRITAADGTTQDYVVTVTIALNPAKDLTGFSFLSANNGGLGADVTGQINGAAVAVTVPFATDVTALKATFAITGASATVGGVVQTSGLSAVDFTSPVTYRVTAADGTTQDYVVTVTVALNPAKDLTALSFLTVNNGELAANVSASIVGAAVTATVPYGTNVTALKATFAITGASAAVGAVTQVSGVTADDFTSPVTYTVTAADGTTKDYVVTVTVALNPAKDLTAFSFLTVNNSGFGPDVVALISGTSITATVPFGTDVTALRATFTTTGASVKVGAATQTSDQTANDFTSPVAYVVHAADGSTQTYTVTVTIALNPAKELTAFSFLSVNNSALTADYAGSIVGATISVSLPVGTPLTALKATFATSGASVKVGAVPQTSGQTANDFTSVVTYQVTAADGSTKDFTVTITTLFGGGGGGALNVTGASVINTSSASIAAVAGATTGMISNGTGSFSAGQEVLLHQTQSATGAVGYYEFARIASVAGSTLTFATPLAHTYTTMAADVAQVVAVPEYTTVDVADGGTLAAPPWNGSSGGILVFDAQATVSVAGAVTMAGAGYRGAAQLDCGTTCIDGHAGESHLGAGARSTSANGAGGGGGAQGQDCGGGGGGGYGGVGSDGSPVGGGTCAIGGVGVAGAADGTASLADAVLFGGAGGEGGYDEDGGLPGMGGGGGGVIIIRAAGVTVAATGSINAKGGDGGGGGNPGCGGGCGMGGGGGGAGGAIRLFAQNSVQAGTNQVVSTGGTGGECSCTGDGLFGGTGSDGRVGILALGGVTGATTPAYDPN